MRSAAWMVGCEVVVAGGMKNWLVCRLPACPLLCHVSLLRWQRQMRALACLRSTAHLRSLSPCLTETVAQRSWISAPTTGRESLCLSLFGIFHRRLPLNPGYRSQNFVTFGGNTLDGQSLPFNRRATPLRLQIILKSRPGKKYTAWRRSRLQVIPPRRLKPISVQWR